MSSWRVQVVKLPPIYRGAPYSVPFRVLQAGTAVNITGWGGGLRIVSASGPAHTLAEEPVVPMAGSTEHLVAAIPASVTTTLPRGDAGYQLWVVDPNGAVFDAGQIAPIAEGPIEVKWL